MTQECLSTWTSYFACKTSTLAKKYYNSLEVGSNCSQTYLFQLQLSVALIEQICDIDLATEECLEEDDICEIIDKLKYILDRDKCNCCND